MLKSLVGLHLDDKLRAEAQRLVDAGEFDSLTQMVENALREYLQNFDAAPAGDGLDALAGDGQHGLPARNGGAASPPSRAAEALGAALDGRTLLYLTEAFSLVERDAFEELVMAYSALAQHPLQDAEMRELAEISRTHHLQDALNALDEAQHSKVPLSPAYLHALLDKKHKGQGQGAADHGGGSSARTWDGPERVSADFNNPLAAAVAGLYEKEIGLLTERVKDQIATYIVEFPDLAHWDEAFAAAASMNKRSFRYVLGVLRGNATKVVEQKGRDNRGLSKSERHREAKRSRNKDYKDYWDARLKARQDVKPD